MTKKRFLLKMNARLVSIESKRRNEILNHYRTAIDQSIANGNTEESTLDSFGDINYLCGLILKKEKKTRLVPLLFTIMQDILICLKTILLIACICALVAIAAVTITSGYSLVMMMLHSFVPSSVLISANIIAAIFKIGACLIIASVLIVLILIVKVAITNIVKVVIHIINSVKDSVYTAQSTRMMKEAFYLETLD